MNRFKMMLLLALAFPVGCSETPSVPEIGEPFFYLVLYPGKVWDAIGEGSSYAMALTLHSTVDVRCRSVEALSMHRESDGAPFAWQLAGFCQGVAISNPTFPSASCCTLPLTDGDSLGNRDLEAGETYDLLVESEGARIEGRTRIPSTFSVQVVQEEGRHIAVWSTSDGAGGYTVTTGNHDVVLTTDTALVLPADPAERFVHVEALDENLYRYLASELSRSGIDTGQGLFGAMWSPGIVSY